MNPVLEAAWSYGARGWRVVATIGKSPAMTLGAGWQRQATGDPQVLAEWWRRWPSANVGVVPCESFIAFDVDVRHGGDDLIHELERDLGELPVTPSYLTGGPDGGWRLLFEHPRLACRQSLGHGLELPGMIVMPPSVHPDTGRRYTWDNDLDDVPLASLPERWRERLSAPPVLPATAPRRDDALREIPAETYIRALTGRRPDRRGYVQCPFHKGGEERRPDLKVYGTTWACFACPPRAGAGRAFLGGGIYQFAAVLWGYPLPLRGVSYLHIRERLLAVMVAHLAGAAA